MDAKKAQSDDMEAMEDVQAQMGKAEKAGRQQASGRQGSRKQLGPMANQPHQSGTGRSPIKSL